MTGGPEGAYDYVTKLWLLALVAVKIKRLQISQSISVISFSCQSR